MKKQSVVRSIVFSRTIFLFAAAVVFAIIAITALRGNYSKMTELREPVNTADQNNANVEKALQDLREHVHGHMNTNLASGPNAIRPPIQLKARYERLMSVEQEEVKAANAEITAKAESICSARFPAAGFNSDRVACVTDYVSANAANEPAVAEDLYKFDFISPKWSPDLAGFSLLAAGGFFIAFIVISGYRILKRR